MCLEHKYYWQCCLNIDSTLIDSCPDADRGFKCQIKERVHPIGGYCRECRISRNKVEDDIVSNPKYSHNDDYQRPWESDVGALVAWKGGRSQSVTPSVQTERGRRSRRFDEPPVPSSKGNFSYYYTERAQTPPRPPPESDSSDDDKYSHRRLHKGHRHSRPEGKHGQEMHKPYLPAVQYRVASPKTIHRLQQNGMIAPEKCRVIATPAELRRAQKQGLVPSTEVLQQLQMQHRSKH